MSLGRTLESQKLKMNGLLLTLLVSAFHMFLEAQTPRGLLKFCFALYFQTVVSVLSHAATNSSSNGI